MKKKLEESVYLTRLIKAITTENIAEAGRLITEINNEDINAADENGNTALTWAAFGGHKEVCELLIPKMSSDAIKSTDKNGNTALHAAAFGGYMGVCELLISISPDGINIADGEGWTTLHFAALGGHKEVCELLINKMSSEAINAVDKNGDTALHTAAFKGHKVCELLIHNMTLEAINAAGRNGWTALHTAIFGGHKEICELLVSKMSPVAINVISNYGNTALHLAAEGGHKEICKVLIENMHAKKIMALLKQSNNDSPIQKATDEIVADFIKDKFLNSKINPMGFTGYQIKLLKLYQVIDHDLLKSYLNEEKSHISRIGIANNYIVKHYFTIIGVCKSVSTDNPISILVNSDCMPHMLSYLAPHSLCPELFAPIELLGEYAVVSSEN
jgi:ankyrin repeat protein